MEILTCSGLMGRMMKWIPSMGMSINAALAAFSVEVVLFGPPATLLKEVTVISKPNKH